MTVVRVVRYCSSATAEWRGGEQENTSNETVLAGAASGGESGSEGSGSTTLDLHRLTLHLATAAHPTLSDVAVALSASHSVHLRHSILLLMYQPAFLHLTSPLGLLVLLSILLLLLNLLTRQPALNMTTPAATTITTVTPTTASPILALNLCLLPPPSSTVYRLSHQLNGAMHELDSHSFLFSDTRHAHVTVVQCYIDSSQLSALLHDLQSFLTSSATASFTPLQLTVGDLAGGPLQEGRYVPSLAIPPTDKLTAFHAQLLSVAEPYTLSNPPPNAQLQSAFYTDHTAPRVDDGTTDWVATFRTNAAYDKYFPHVTLGTCECSETELQGIQKQKVEAMNGSGGGVGGEQWLVDRLYVFQLGNTGTVRKQLAEIQFG